MSETKSMLYLYVETPLHAGTGRALGAVDLPIQRERTTGYPIVQASGLKGSLRAGTKRHISDNNDWLSVFGPEQDSDDEGKKSSDFAGSLFIGDARILLFPVRSLAGVFAWVTSRDVLERFARQMKLVDGSFALGLPDRDESDSSAWTTEKSEIILNGSRVVLEEYAFDITTSLQNKKAAVAVAEKLKGVFPRDYSYWQGLLTSKLCILPDDAFRDFVKYGTEIQTHIALDPDKKVVKTGALWTSESLPVDTILYAPVIATRARNKKAEEKDADDKATMKIFADALKKLPRMQLGGDETTGQGMVALQLGGAS